MDIKQIGQTVAVNAVIGVLAVGCGYLLGTNETQAMKHRMAAIELTLERIQLESKEADKEAERIFQGRFEFMNNATQRLEYLCRNAEGCEARFAPMRVPE